MPSHTRISDDDAATRALARDLLSTALLGPQPIPVPQPQMPLHEHTGSARYWTRERIEGLVLVFRRHAQRLPTRAEWDRARDYRLPTRHTVQRVYGSMGALVQALAVAVGQQREDRCE